MSQKGMSLSGTGINYKIESQQKTTKWTEASAKGRADVEPRNGKTASEKLPWWRVLALGVEETSGALYIS
ncbi:hypothetical protein N7526_008189 [Penicillium atrosanguineum]|nr:hypothetical protein N7526_008189 [Penicillium atrosanguineum]